MGKRPPPPDSPRYIRSKSRIRGTCGEGAAKLRMPKKDNPFTDNPFGRFDETNSDPFQVLLFHGNLQHKLSRTTTTDAQLIPRSNNAANGFPREATAYGLRGLVPAVAIIRDQGSKC